MSRQQLTVAWSAARRAFDVRALPGSRRALRILRDDGAPREGDAIEPGSLVAIGDRALLLLGCGRVLPAAHPTLVGGSVAMTALRMRIDAVASATDDVLVHGETGVGKELVARAIHDASKRSRGPFVPVNCAALSEELLESELFGHARGAFSGALTAKEGLFRSATGGTLFLDEIGELSLALQPKLLRTLQERTVRAVGESRESHVDVRVVAATNRDLAREVEAGRFRADLYARLEAPAIDVPPLRARRSDAGELFVRMLTKRIDATDASDPLRALFRAADTHAPPVPLAFFLDMLAHDWPRNVRELEKHVASVAVATRQHGHFEAPPLVRAQAPSEPPPAPAAAAPSSPPRGRPSVTELQEVLDANDYVQARVAQVLGVSRTTLDKWMRELGVRRPRDVPRAEIDEARVATNGDILAMARRLGISERGLKLRVKEIEREG